MTIKSLRAITIDNFDKRLDPNTLAAGEQYYAMHDCEVKEGTEPELYTFLFNQEQEKLNVEVWLKQGKIKTAVCACEAYREHKFICLHITAALFALKEIQTAKRIPELPAITVPDLPTLHVNHLLNVMSTQNLVHFIKHSLRDHKDLTVLLKLKYAHLLVIENNDQKYDMILQSMFRPYISGTLNASSYKKLVSWLEEGVAIGADLIVMGQWKEAVLLMTAISRKIHYLAYRKPEYKSLLLKVNHLWYASIRKLVGLNLPPEVKTFIQERLYPLATSPHYQMVHYEENVHTLLWTYFWGKSEQQTHLEFLKEKSLNQTDFRLQHFICSWYVSPKAALASLNPVQWSGTELESLADYFLHHKHTVEIDELVQRLLEPGFSPWFQEKIIDKLSGIKHKYSPDLLQRIWQFLLLKPKPDVAVMVWESGVYGQSMMLEYFDQKKIISRDRLVIIIATLAEEHEWLVDYWGNEFSPATIKPILPLLSTRWTPEAITALMDMVITNYLRDHLGEQPIRQVRELIDYFYQRNTGHIAKALKDAIKLSYPERLSLHQL